MSSHSTSQADPISAFNAERIADIARMARDGGVKALAHDFMMTSTPYKYSYNFEWLGRPIIQFPQDIVAYQEVVWRTRPDLIIETGIAHGGSLVLSASLLALLDLCDAASSGAPLDARTSYRKVVGIDIDIRQHNRTLIERHPLASRIHMIQGSSVDPLLVASVHELAKPYQRVMVCLDSNHTHEHVLRELEAYAPLVSLGCYCIVWDTIVDDMPEKLLGDRPWGPGNNPKTAVHEYLRHHPEFEIDKTIDHKLLISVAPDGYLRRVS